MTLAIAGCRREMFDLYRFAEARWRSVEFLMRCTSDERCDLANIPDHPQSGGVQGGPGSRARSRSVGVDSHGLVSSVDYLLADVERYQCGLAYPAGLGRATAEVGRRWLSTLSNESSIVSGPMS
jgi:hypothetical protein